MFKYLNFWVTTRKEIVSAQIRKASSDADIFKSNFLILKILTIIKVGFKKWFQHGDVILTEASLSYSEKYIATPLTTSKAIFKIMRKQLLYHHDLVSLNSNAKLVPQYGQTKRFGDCKENYLNAVTFSGVFSVLDKTAWSFDGWFGKHWHFNPFQNWMRTRESVVYNSRVIIAQTMRSYFSTVCQVSPCTIHKWEFFNQTLHCIHSCVHRRGKTRNLPARNVLGLDLADVFWWCYFATKRPILGILRLLAYTVFK